jgi:hypothetical protein
MSAWQVFPTPPHFLSHGSTEFLAFTFSGRTTRHKLLMNAAPSSPHGGHAVGMPSSSSVSGDSELVRCT